MKKYNLILDDYRSQLDVWQILREPVLLENGWAIAKSHGEFVDKVTEMYDGGYFPSVVCFDHDLVDEHYKYLVNPIPYHLFTVPTGWHSAKWFLAFCEEKGVRPNHIFVHTMNPAGKQNIVSVLAPLVN